MLEEKKKREKAEKAQLIAENRAKAMAEKLKALGIEPWDNYLNFTKLIKKQIKELNWIY